MSTHILKNVAIVIIALNAISGLVSIFLPPSQAFQIVFGTVYVLVVPGYFWTHLITKKLELLERIITAIALSIVFVPLAMYVASKIGVKPSTLSISIEIFLLALIPIVIIITKQLAKNHYV